jgi:signal transduction histidine kinase
MTFVEALPFNLISTALLIIYFTFFKWIFRNREILLIVGLTIGLAIFAIVGPLVLYLESFINIQLPEYIGTATIFVGTIYGISNLGYTILTSQRTQMVSDLTQVNENLETTISLLRQKEWIARRQVGYVMHGSLQSSLNAAILQLGSSTDPSAELIESVRSDISKALARVSSDSEQSHSFEQAKNEITKIWAGAIQINWMVDPKALAQLQRNPETSECLAEVTREAVSNAAKHGSANQIEIVVNIEDSSIYVEVKDNGKSLNTGNTQGLGSELFDDLCSRWELVRTDQGGMKLSANLVLQRFGL